MMGFRPSIHSLFDFIQGFTRFNKRSTVRQSYTPVSGVPKAILVALLWATVTFSQAAKYYVEPLNGDNTRTTVQAQDPSTPWKTVAFAISQAALNDSLVLLPGTYTETNLVVTKSLKIFGNETNGIPGTGSKPVFSGSSPAFNGSVFNIQSNRVRIQNLEIRVDQNFTSSGIFCAGSGFNGLVVADNHIFSTRTGTVSVFTTYGILLGQSTNFAGNDSAVIVRNIVRPLNSSSALFGRAIRMNGGFARIGSNLEADSNQLMGDYGIQVGTATGLMQILNNHIFGRSAGIELNLPAANRTHRISGNRIQPVPGGLSLSAIELKNNVQTNSVIEISGNRIEGHAVMGIFSTRSRNVQVHDNVFIPSDTAKNYTHIVVNTKQQTTSTSETAVTSGITVTGNDFRASTAGGGRGISFQNHFAGAVPPFANVQIGGAGALANTFAANIGLFVVLDSASGNCRRLPLWNQTGIPATPMAPVNVNLDLSQNRFDLGSGGNFPSALSTAELMALENKLLHKIDFDSLGFLTVIPNRAFVTQSSFITPKTTGPSLNRGVAALVGDNGILFAEPGSYPDNLDIRKGLEINAEPNTSDLSFPSLSLNETGKTLRLNAGTLLGTALNLNGGWIELGDKNLTLQAGGSLTGGSELSFVNTRSQGKLVRKGLTGTAVYPIGLTGRYLPVELNNQGDVDQFGLRIQNDVLDGGLSGNPVDSAVGLTWVLEEGSGNGTGNLGFKPLWMGSDEKNGFNRSSTSLQAYFAGSWVNLAGTQQTAATGSDPYQASYPGLTNFFPGLPLRIRNFAAQGNIYYVDDDSGDDTRTPDQAKIPTTPWKTIGKALASVADGDSIQVMAGTYAESNLNITKAVNLFGNVAGVGTGVGAGTGIRPIVNGFSLGPDSTIFSVKSPNVLIRNFQIEVNQGLVIHGIMARQAGYNNLRILDNHILATKPNPGFFFIPCLQFNTYGIRLVGFQSDSFTIKRNYIGPSLTDGTICFMGRGIKLFGGHGTIGGPIAADSNRILAYYSVQAGDTKGGTLKVENNYLLGIGMQIVSPAANSGIHRIQNNRFYVAYPQSFPMQFEIRDVQNAGTGVDVIQNTFTGFSNSGVFVQRSKNVRLFTNIFQPVDTASNFRGLVVNTKMLTRGTPPAPVPTSVLVKGNVFFGTNTADRGTAIEFGNHHDDPTTPLAFSNVEIGGPGGEANTFSQNLRRFMVLDASTGSSNQFQFWSGSAGTTIQPVRDNFDLSENQFEVSGGTKRPAAMSTGELYEVEDKIQHGIDASVLGFVTIKANEAYVTENSFLAPASSGPSLQRAHNVLSSGGSIFTRASLFNETATLSKSLTMDANPISSFRISGLKMNGASATVSTADSIFIGDTLALTDGILELGAGSLVLDADVVQSGGSASSFVRTTGNGEMVHFGLGAIEKHFTVGVGNSYTPLHFSNSGTSDRFGVRVTDGVFTNGNPQNGVVGVTWHLNEGTPGGSSLNARFGWAGSEEEIGFDRSTCFVDQLLASWQTLSGPAGLPATGSDPYQVQANLVASFNNTQLRVASTFSPGATGTLYYVDDNTGNDTRTNADATNPSTPWKTLTKALASMADGDSVQVMEGTYAEAGLLVDKKISILGNVPGIGVGVGAGNGIRPIINGTIGIDSAIFTVKSSDVLIRNFEMEVNQTSITVGVYGRNGNFNNLRLFDNRVYSTGVSAIPGLPCIQFNTYGMRFLNGGTDSVIIKGNFIQPKNLSNNCAFGRGIRTFSGGRFVIGGPLAADSNRIVGLYCVQMGDLGGQTIVQNNAMAGQGVEITAPRANSGIHQVLQNRVFAVIPQVFLTLMEVKDVQKVGTGVLVEGNRITGHSNIGFFSERSQNITLRNNLFIPSDTARNYYHIAVNTKQQTTSVNQNPAVPNSIVIQGNDLRSNNVNGGTAIIFANHNDNPNAANAFTNVVIGGPGTEANTFGLRLKYALALDPKSGPSNTIQPWTSLPVTTMKPVSDVFDINENLFTLSSGIKRPATMTDDDYFELEDKVLHGMDYDSLGFIVWKTNHAYVTEGSFIQPYTSTPSLQRAALVTGTADGWTINLKPAELNEVVTVTKAMTWNTHPADTIRLGGIVMQAPDKALTLTDKFVITNNLDLTSAAGGRILLNESDLVVLPTAILSGGTEGTYVATNGNGYFVHRSANDQPKNFPVGTLGTFAPVLFDDANNTGDNIKIRVRPAATANDFTPPLPATIGTFATLQWNICEDNPGGSSAALRFNWVDPLNVSGSGTINAISRFDGSVWSSQLATIGPGLVANGFNYTGFCTNFALVGDPNLTSITTQNIIKVPAGVAGRYCLGDSIKIPFVVAGTGLITGNQFQAFISDAAGNFPGPILTPIGVLSGNLSDTIRTRIPSTLAPGLNYRIRVVSTNIAVTGTTSPDSIKIFGLPARPLISGDSTLCQGETSTLSTGTATGYLWLPSGEVSQNLVVNSTVSVLVRISDENGCQNTSAVRNISVLPTPVAEPITNTGTLVRCDGDSIILTANPAGLNYTWLNTSPVVNSRDLTVKTSGSYQVVVSNANGCADTSEAVTATFNSLPPKPAISSPNDTLCQPGTLSFGTAVTGVGYDWTVTGITPNPNGQNVDITAPGAYTASLTITDANGCKSTSDPINGLLKAAPVAPTIRTLGNDVSVCEGDTLRLQALPFSAGNTYNWTPGNIQVGTLIITSPGLQTVGLSVDSNGCSTAALASLAVNINARPVTPTATVLSGQLSFCAGDSVILTSSAGTSYAWSPGGANSQNLVVKTSGSYSVVVRNDSSCASLPSVALQVEVKKNPEIPQISATRTTFCFGEQATLSISNPGAANTYTWSPAGTGVSIDVNAAGTYSVRSDSTNGCLSNSASVQITVNPLPEPVISSSELDNRICKGDSVILTSNYANGNAWIGISGTNLSPRLVIRNTSPGILLRVTDANGCVSVAGPVGILVDTLPRVRLLKDTALVIRDNMPLAAIGGPANAEVYEWFKGNLLLGQTGGNVPTFETAVTNTSLYSVLLTDSNGCRVSDTILVKVSNEVFIPNSFSPNKDGNNDRFKVYGYGVKTIDFKIFDRLGNVVYETNRVEDIVETSETTDTVPGWDGTKDGKDVSQESYIWSIKGTFETGEPIRVTGGNLSGSVIILN